MSGAVEVVIARLRELQRAPVPRGPNWIARCPAHDDRRPSLTVSQGRNGRALLKCWAGCPTAAVVHALGLDWRDLFEQPLRRWDRP